MTFVIESTLARRARRANFTLIFPQFPPFSALFVPVLGTHCCLKTDILMLLSHFGYGIFGFSHIFCSFPPHPFLFGLIFMYPHRGDPEKAGVMSPY